MRTEENFPTYFKCQWQIANVPGILVWSFRHRFVASTEGWRILSEEAANDPIF